MSRAIRFDEPEDGIRRKLSLEDPPVRPAVPLDILPVIHPGAFEFFVVKLEAERLDEVQFCAGGRAEPRHVARVGRDFRFNQDDVHVGKFQVQRLKLKKNSQGEFEAPSAAWLVWCHENGFTRKAIRSSPHPSFGHPLPSDGERDRVGTG